MPAPAITRIDDMSGLKTAMSQVFQDAQMNLSSHRKLIVVLINIQQRAVEIGAYGGFQLYFTKLINLALKMKKGEKSADRISKFVSAFVTRSLKQESELGESGVASELVRHIIQHVIIGCDSKDRNVRYRVVQLLAYVVNHLSELDEDVLETLYTTLEQRLNDREAIVRIQAVVAMSVFQFTNKSVKFDQGYINAGTFYMLNAMKNDESPEVRRAAMLNLEIEPEVVPEVLERARDVNSINRRLVYSKILKGVEHTDIDPELREKILNWGLKDRDEKVRQAATRLITHYWSEAVQDDILEFIHILNITKSEIAVEAMMVYYKTRQDKFQEIEITGQDWKQLTTAKSFLIRTYYQYCKQNKLYNLIDKNFPELSDLAETLSKFLNLRRDTVAPLSGLIGRYRQYASSLDTYKTRYNQNYYYSLDLERQVKVFERKMDELESSKTDFKRADRRIQQRKMELGNEMHLLSSQDPRKDDYLNEMNECELERSTLSVSMKEINEKIEKIQTLSKEVHGNAKKNHENIIKYKNKSEKLLESSKNLKEQYEEETSGLEELDFVIEQLLLTVNDYDFDDVVGSRKMLPVIRTHLTHSDLPDKLVAILVSVLKKLAANENDFASLCVEAITDIRDSTLEENDETFVSAHEEIQPSNDPDDLPDSQNEDEVEEDEEDEHGNKRRKVEPKELPQEILTQCLAILQHYLEEAEEPMANVGQSQSLLDTLVLPALKSQVSSVKLQGFKCLGLICLIDKEEAERQLQFIGTAASQLFDPRLTELCLMTIFDLIATHGTSIFSPTSENGKVDSLSLGRLFHLMLNNRGMPSVQVTVAEGLSKLFLADLLVDFGEGLIDDSSEKQEYELLSSLVLAYFSPANANNHELKQTLAFCLPVFAFSHPLHQAKIVEISGDCFFRMYQESDIVKEGLPSPSIVLNQFINWTDPHNVVNQDEMSIKRSQCHLWLAIRSLQNVEQETTKAAKKSILSNLNKLYLTEFLGTKLLSGLDTAIEDTKAVFESWKSDNVYELDVPSEKNLSKFHATVKELLEKAEVLERETGYEQNEMEVEQPEKESEENEGENQDPEESEKSEAEADEFAADKLAKSPSHSNALSEIDRLIEEEDNVEYDIDMDS